MLRQDAEPPGYRLWLESDDSGEFLRSFYLSKGTWPVWAEPYLMLGQARNAMFNVEGIEQDRKRIN